MGDNKLWEDYFPFQRALNASNLSIYCREVARVLAVYVDTNGRCFPSLPTIAKGAGCSTRSVTRALAELALGGWVTRYEGGVGVAVSHYQLAVGKTLADEHREKIKARKAARSRQTVHTVSPDSPHPIDQESTPYGLTGDTGIDPGATRSTQENYSMSTHAPAPPPEASVTWRKVRRKGKEARQDYSASNCEPGCWLGPGHYGGCRTRPLQPAGKEQ